MRPGTIPETIAGARVAIATQRLADAPTLGHHRGRSTARERADRGLIEGRLVILHVDSNRVSARWRGEGHIYRLGLDAGTWACTCPARSDQCSHLIALRRVIAVRGDDAA